MTKVTVTAAFDTPAAELWKVIGGFNALPEWHPGVASSAIQYIDGGTVRVLELAAGGRIVERIEDVDYHGHAYTYSIVEGAVPVSSYLATLRVTKARRGAGARAEWSAEFTADGAPEDEVAGDCKGFYRAGFDNLAGVLAARGVPPPAPERRKRSPSGRRKSDPASAKKKRR